MARPRAVPTLAAAVLAVPAALVVAPNEAEASHDRYTIVQTVDYSGTQWGSRFIFCNGVDFAISHRITDKTGPAKVRGATFYSSRAGDRTAPGLESREGMVVEWRDNPRGKPGKFTVSLACEPD